MTIIATATTPPTMMPVLAPDDDDDAPLLATAWSFGAGVTMLSSVVGFVEPFPVVAVVAVVIVVVVRVALAVVSVVYKMKSYSLNYIIAHS